MVIFKCTGQNKLKHLFLEYVSFNLHASKIMLKILQARL